MQKKITSPNITQTDACHCKFYLKMQRESIMLCSRTLQHSFSKDKDTDVLHTKSLNDRGGSNTSKLLYLYNMLLTILLRLCSCFCNCCWRHHRHRLQNTDTDTTKSLALVSLKIWPAVLKKHLCLREFFFLTA